MDQGGWRCLFHDKTISTDEQRLACEKHLYNHHLVPHEMVDMDAPGNFIKYKKIDGVEFYNGQKIAPGYYTSSEIKAAPALLGDPGADSLRTTFGGVFVDGNE
tara:strand:- start:939 stop:1247 length:309 start_codon:yes stop_codon:yes gene_type:complete